MRRWQRAVGVPILLAAGLACCAGSTASASRVDSTPESRLPLPPPPLDVRAWDAARSAYQEMLNRFDDAAPGPRQRRSSGLPLQAACGDARAGALRFAREVREHRWPDDLQPRIRFIRAAIDDLVEATNGCAEIPLDADVSELQPWDLESLPSAVLGSILFPDSSEWERIHGEPNEPAPEPSGGGCGYLRRAEARRILGTKLTEAKATATACGYRAGRAVLGVTLTRARRETPEMEQKMRDGRLAEGFGAIDVVHSLPIAAYWQKASGRPATGILTSYPGPAEVHVVVGNTPDRRAKAIATMKLVLKRMPSR